MQADNYIPQDQVPMDQISNWRRAKNQQVPSRAAVQSSIDKDRTASQPTGRFAVFLNTLRKQDAQAIPELSAIVGFVPNSRYVWMHSIFEAIKTGKKVSQPDIDYVKTFWMKSDIQKDLLSYLSKNLDSTIKAFTVSPTVQPPKSNFVPIVDSTGNLKFTLLNPGIINLNLPKQLLQQLRAMPEKDYVLLNNAIHNLVLDWTEKNSSTVDNTQAPDEIIRALYSALNSTVDVNVDLFNPALVNTLYEIRKDFLENRVNMKKLFQYADMLQKFHYDSQTSYLGSLFNPWTALDAKIPAAIPIPTSSFKIRTSVTLTTNALGNVAFGIFPFFLATTDLTTFGVNNHASLSGTLSSAYFVPKAIGQQLPSAIYNSYRLVSAAVRLTTISSTLNASGSATIGTLFDDTFDSQSVSTGSNIPAFAPYGNFQLIENLFYRDTVAITPGSTLIGRYIPKDEDLLDYSATGYGKPTAILGYMTGGPASSPIARLDYVANYEAIPNPSYTDYLPHTISDETEIPKNISPALTLGKTQPTEVTPPYVQAPKYGKMMDMPNELTPIKLPPDKSWWQTLIANAGDLLSMAKTAYSEFAPTMMNITKTPY